jgi:hypothetical protein
MATVERSTVGERVAPNGRDARLWRVLLELSRAVAEAVREVPDRPDAPNPNPNPKPLPPGHLERLVVEFDDAYTTFVEGMTQLPSEAQLISLQAVDRQLESMVRAREAELWTKQALREDGRWAETERLASVAIEAFAWPRLRLALVVSETVEETGGVVPSGRRPGESGRGA